jgi:cyclase
MTRQVVLGTVMAIGACALVVSAYQAPPAASPSPGPKVVEVEKLKDNLFLLKGGGGNTAVFVGTSGVVVVDTKLPGWGQPILDKIKELTPKPVTTIINTHTHGDHVSGNVEFPATVDVVTHENTKANMQKMAVPTGIAPAQVGPNVFQASGGKGMPKRTFKDTLTLDKGPDRVDLHYFGRGHTSGDAFVVFPALRVMHAGDIFARKAPPLLDGNNGGSGVAIGDTLAKAAGIKGVDSVITGHSTVMTLADLEEYARYNKDFLTWVRAQMAAGKTVEAAAAEYTLPASYAGYTNNPERVKLNIGVIYDELKR